MKTISLTVNNMDKWLNDNFFLKLKYDLKILLSVSPVLLQGNDSGKICFIINEFLFLDQFSVIEIVCTLKAAR